MIPVIPGLLSINSVNKTKLILRGTVVVVRRLLLKFYSVLQVV